MFWVDVGLVGLSVVLCAASIVSISGFGLGLFVLGAVLFLPASIRLAARLSPQPGVQGLGDTQAPIKKRPILEASLNTATGLIGLGNAWSLHAASGAGAFRYAELAVFVLLAGWGIYGLWTALLAHNSAQN